MPFDTIHCTSYTEYVEEIRDFCANLDHIKRRYWNWLASPVPLNFPDAPIRVLYHISRCILERGSRYLDSYWLLCGSVGGYWRVSDTNTIGDFWQAVIRSGDFTMFQHFLIRKVHYCAPEYLLDCILRMPRQRYEERRIQRQFYDCLFKNQQGFSVVHGGKGRFGGYHGAVHIAMPSGLHKLWRDFLEDRLQDDRQHKEWFIPYIKHVIEKVPQRTPCYKSFREWFEKILKHATPVQPGLRQTTLK